MKSFFLVLIFSSSFAFAQTPTETVSAQATTVTTATAVQEVRSLWSLSYFNFAASGLNVANYNTPSLNIYQYFAANYKLSSDEKISFRFPFTIVTPGVGSSAGDMKGVTSYPGDFHLTYANYKMARLADWNLSGTLYLYLPTTEVSQNKKWIARNMAWFILENKINPEWKLTYNSKPEYFWNTQKSFRNEKIKNYPDGTSSSQVFPDANLLGKYDHYIGISRQFGQNFSLQLDAGFIHEWYQDSQWTTNPLNTDSFKLSPNTYVRVNSALSFIFGIENKIDIRTPKKDFALFREDESSYYLMTFWTVL